jgi:hypothetical protein
VPGPTLIAMPEICESVFGWGASMGQVVAESETLVAEAANGKNLYRRTERRCPNLVPHDRWFRSMESDAFAYYEHSFWRGTAAAVCKKNRAKSPRTAKKTTLSLLRPLRAELSGLMHGAVTVSTKGDQILFGVIPTATAENFVVDLEVVEATTSLAPPSVALQHSQPNTLVRFVIES